MAGRGHQLPRVQPPLLLGQVVAHIANEIELFKPPEYPSGLAFAQGSWGALRIFRPGVLAALPPSSLPMASSPAAPDRLTRRPPPLVPTIFPNDLTPRRQRAVLGPVGQRPLPRLPPQIPARLTSTARPLPIPGRR
jgi:hypothetical protein